MVFNHFGLFNTLPHRAGRLVLGAWRAGLVGKRGRGTLYTLTSTRSSWATVMDLCAWRRAGFAGLPAGFRPEWTGPDWWAPQPQHQALLLLLALALAPVQRP